MAQSREEFLKRRQAGIGGSDVAVILGLSKWKTPFGLWQEKTGKVKPDDETSERMHFGNVLEQVVADEFSRRNGLKVERRNNMFVKDNILIANIDRYIVGEKAVLECKTADRFTAHLWGSDENDEIPDYYLAQVTHYQYVTGYQELGYLAVLIGGNEYRQFRIKYNPALGEYIAEQCVNWWDKFIKKDTPPSATQNDNLSNYFKYSAGASITASAEILDAVEELRAVKAAIKTNETQKDELEFRIKNFIGENEVLFAPDGSKLATWKQSTSRRIDTTALKHDYPEVASLVETESISRRFLLK
ncbi:MAG: YqaJ viral recombinase family protein [Victivallales bacterium]